MLPDLMAILPMFIQTNSAFVRLHVPKAVRWDGHMFFQNYKFNMPSTKEVQQIWYQFVCVSICEHVCAQGDNILKPGFSV
jgi:hypothetical protein